MEGKVQIIDLAMFADHVTTEDILKFTANIYNQALDDVINLIENGVDEDCIRDINEMKR
jgi:hypothetical protein